MLLQRERELASIEQQLDAARRGHGSLAAIVGAAGSGKTSLIAAAAERAQADGLRVLRARASEMERSFAFGVARQLFEPLLSRRDPESAASLFGGPAGLAAPILGRWLEHPPPPPGEPRHAALLGLHWLLVNLAAEQPIVGARRRLPVG